MVGKILPTTERGSPAHAGIDFQEARTQTIEQAEALQALIQQEIERLKGTGQRRHLWPGAQAQERTADLAHLATALKDASAARFAALADTD